MSMGVGVFTGLCEGSAFILLLSFVLSLVSFLAFLSFFLSLLSPLFSFLSVLSFAFDSLAS